MINQLGVESIRADSIFISVVAKNSDCVIALVDDYDVFASIVFQVSDLDLRWIAQAASDPTVHKSNKSR
jgi:hypothetical protein